jgi:hypothetical protein
MGFSEIFRIESSSNDSKNARVKLIYIMFSKGKTILKSRNKLVYVVIDHFPRKRCGINFHFIYIYIKTNTNIVLLKKIKMTYLLNIKTTIY